MVITRMESRLENVEKCIADLKLQREADRDLLLARFAAIEGSLTSLLQSRQGNGENECQLFDVGSSSGNGTAQAHSTEHWRKMEIPLFTGENAFDWLARIERFFKIRGVPEEEWVMVAILALEGEALTWYNWWETYTFNPTWTLLKSALLKSFQSDLCQNPFEVLLGLKQEGSVKEYRRKFELFSGPLKIQERKYLIGLFLNGLQPEIRAELKLHNVADSLDEIIMLAELIDDKNRVLKETETQHSQTRGANQVNFVDRGSRTTTMTWPVRSGEMEAGQKNDSKALEGPFHVRGYR